MKKDQEVEFHKEMWFSACFGRDIGLFFKLFQNNNLNFVFYDTEKHEKKQ